MVLFILWSFGLCYFIFGRVVLFNSTSEGRFNFLVIAQTEYRALCYRLLQCNTARPFLIIFIFVTFDYRQKHGLVRNDFLDCMMELRQASKDEAQGDVQSAKKSNTGATYSKLQQNVILGETRY